MLFFVHQSTKIFNFEHIFVRPSRLLAWFFFNSIFRGTLGGIRTSITWRKTARVVRLSSIIVQNGQEFNPNVYLRDINL